MAAPRGFPTLLPATNDSSAGEVLLHKVTTYLDLGDVLTTALRYFGAPVTLLYDPYRLTAYIITDSEDRDILIGFADESTSFRVVKPIAGQSGTVLKWELDDESSPAGDVDEAVDKIITPQIPRFGAGNLLNSVHIASNGFSLLDQNTGKVKFFTPSDAVDLSNRIAAVGFPGSSKRVVLKFNPPTSAAF